MHADLDRCEFDEKRFDWTFLQVTEVVPAVMDAEGWQGLCAVVTEPQSKSSTEQVIYLHCCTLSMPINCTPLPVCIQASSCRVSNATARELCPEVVILWISGNARRLRPS